MSSPFLMNFVAGLVDRMLAERELEILPDSFDRVVHFVSGRLAGEGLKSLVSTLTRAFEECDDVLELYADETSLKDRITHLRTR